MAKILVGWETICLKAKSKVIWENNAVLAL